MALSTPPRSIQVGDAVPDVSLRDVDGNDVRLSDYRERRVLLFLWASW